MSDNDFFIEPKEAGRCWFPVYTRPNKEKRLFEFLQGNGINGYLPLRPRCRITRNRKIICRVPMFPGYVFACADPLERYEIKRSNYTRRIFDLDETMEQTLIDELRIVRRIELLAGEQEIEVRPELMPGRKVRIATGSFAGIHGIVRKRQGIRRIIVNLEYLGHSLAVFDVDDVDLADEMT
ncbi:MAG: transcription termination/antitermination NusG family protein [Victivallaceae bacterium]